jgi:dethiobiotin synthetase
MVVSQLISGERKCLPELYNLAKPASPHIAAREEGRVIDLNLIKDHFNTVINVQSTGYLVIEGAGGLLVPLNQEEFVLDLILQLKARVILVSRNYLGSINHSLLTAEVCRQRGVDVIGWIFNDEYLHYHDEIASWSGYPVIGSIPKLPRINREILHKHSMSIRSKLLEILQRDGA